MRHLGGEGRCQVCWAARFVQSLRCGRRALCRACNVGGGDMHWDELAWAASRDVAVHEYDDALVLIGCVQETGEGRTW
jgi:hypothetical protein